MDQETQQSKAQFATFGRLSGLALRVVGFSLLIYLVAIGIYGYYQYEGTRSRLLTYGISEATASLAASAVLLLALAIPAFSVVRIITARGRLTDYVLALSLPLITWFTSFIPANFDAKSGNVLRFCAERPDGSLFCLDHDGIDPLTQKKLMPITTDVAELEFRKRKGMAPKLISASVSSVEFFDPLTGHAKVYFAKNEAGCFDIFDNPGIHPHTGDRLLPATKELVKQLKTCRRQEDSRRGGNSAGTLSPGDVPSSIARQGSVSAERDGILAFSDQERSQSGTNFAMIENNNCWPQDIYFDGRLVSTISPKSVQKIPSHGERVLVRNCISGTSNCSAERAVRWGPSSPSLILESSEDCAIEASRPLTVKLTINNQHCKDQDLYISNELVGRIPANRSRFFDLQPGQHSIRVCVSGTTSCGEQREVRWEPGSRSHVIRRDPSMCPG